LFVGCPLEVFAGRERAGTRTDQLGIVPVAGLLIIVLIAISEKYTWVRAIGALP
jgi:hypothetical protein